MTRIKQEMRLFLSILLMIFWVSSGLKAQADYTCTQALTLVDQKINSVKKEIAQRKQSPEKNTSTIQKIKFINRLIQATYKIIQKSRVGEGLVKYTEAEWLEHNPAELVANIQETQIDNKELQANLDDLKSIKTTLTDYDSADALCDFEIGANPWIEAIDFSVEGKYGQIIDKFELFANRNLEILDILPSSPGLIREEFEDEIFDKTELRTVVKQEIKNRRAMVSKVVRIYRSTKKLS